MILAKNFEKKLIQITLISIAMLVIICSLQANFAADQTINPSMPISSGVAQLNPGNTLSLNSGTYNQNSIQVNGKNNVTIQGNGPTDSVIIDAPSGSNIFTVERSSNVVFRNITFMNGASTSGGVNAHGGAIRIGSESSMISFINCKFINNHANGLGGAIWNSGVSLTINNCTFINNRALNSGGAIYNSGANLNVVNSVFINNTGTINGGAIFTTGNNAHIRDSNFTSNSEAIYFSSPSSNCNVNGCNIINNPNGIFIASGTNNIIIQYNRIFDNTNGSGFNLINNGINTNVNFNWWGSNGHPLVRGVAVQYWFVMMLSVDNPYETMVNSSINRSANNYILSYQLVLYNSTIQVFEFVSYHNLPDFLVNVTWRENGVITHNLNNINAKGTYSNTVSLANNGIISIHALGDNEDVILRIGGEMNIGEVNLTITKTVNVTNPVQKGHPVTYRITVTNHGANDAYHVTVGELLPSSLILISSAHTHGSYMPSIGLWEIGNLNSGETAILTLTVSPTETGLITNDVNLTTDNNNIGNKNSNATIVVKIPSTSTIVIPENVKVGKTIDISGVVTNNEGNPIPHITIHVVVDGKTYTVTTNSHGEWVLPYTPTHTGIIHVSVNWTGNAHHFGFITAESFDVKKTSNENDEDNDEDNGEDNDNDSDDKNNDNSAVNAAMKKTGIQLITLLLVIISLIGLSICQKQK